MLELELFVGLQFVGCRLEDPHTDRLTNFSHKLSII